MSFYSYLSFFLILTLLYFPDLYRFHWEAELLHQPTLKHLQIWAASAEQSGKHLWRVHILERMEQTCGLGIQQRHG